MIPAGPAWLADILAAAMIATALYCASRIVYARARRRRTEHDLDAVHVAMGLAMAGMLVPRLDVLPAGAWGTGVWTGVFCAAAAGFAARAAAAARTGGRRQAAHHVPHLVACAAMLYMLLAPTGGTAAMSATRGMGGMDGVGGGAMDGMSGDAAAVRFPTLALALTVLLVGYAVAGADRIALAAASGSVGGMAASGCAHAPAGPADAVTDPVTNPATDLATDLARGRAGLCGAMIAPRAATCCHIAMNLAMAYMLVILL
ncbi:MAG TPA: DUF5134 domain-containing protein [Actinocrinis sp.]